MPRVALKEAAAIGWIITRDSSLATWQLFCQIG